MKHIKTVVSIILLGSIILGIIGFIDINKRFPQPKKEIYGVGEWVPYKQDIDIKATGIELYSADELEEKYSFMKTGSKKNFDYIVIKMVVSNKSDKNINMYNISNDFNLVIYPIGFENQAMLEVADGNANVAPGEIKEVFMRVIVSEALLKKSVRNKAFKQDIYLCFKAYPVRQAVVFKGVK